MTILRRVALPFTIAGIFIIVAATLVWLGWWIPNFPSTAAYPIRGIDVSHYQGEIHWNQIDASRVHFAYIKATEGSDYRDAEFARNWSESAKAGVARGAYHFFTFGTSGKQQAANFIAAVPFDPGALPPAIDLEISGYNQLHQAPAAEFQKELADFITDVSARFQKEPVVYTTPDFQRDYLGGVSLNRLWIREVLLKPKDDWMFWQFTPRGRVRGVAGYVDLNVFHGTRVQFDALR